MKQTILEAKGLCKSFANNGLQNHVLDHVDVEIYEGDFTVIMGSSGSGKSTLLYCLSGMDHVTSGSVKYRGAELTCLREKEMAYYRQREFGFVFQQVHLVSNLTLFENVAVPGFLNREKRTEQIKARARDLLAQVNVAEAENRLPAQVSGGEAQRAAIARALIGEPGLLFADEPTGALNRRNTEDVLALLTAFHVRGQSILLVTHDIHVALRAGRILYLDDGVIRGELTLPPYEEDEVKSREKQVSAWLSSMNW